MKKIVAVTALIALVLVPGFLKSQTEHRTEVHKHVHNHGAHMTAPKDGQPETVLYKRVIKWLGNFHPISIHFPIALIVMTGISEILFFWTSSPIYQFSSRFMIIAAAISALPTVVLGLAYGYEASYTGGLEDVFWWHRLCGISTTILAIITAFLKELYIRKKIKKQGYYYTSLIVTVLFVTTTGYLGGEMTFGLYNLFP